MKRYFVFITIAILVSGCIPEVRKGGSQIEYQDVDHPLSDTAVFSALTEGTNGLGQITKVDGQPTNCWQYGCPGCLRVLPGTHTFSITHESAIKATRRVSVSRTNTGFRIDNCVST